MAQRLGRPAPASILYALTSFETFDTPAGPGRKLDAVAPKVARLARAALGVDPE